MKIKIQQYGISTTGIIICIQRTGASYRCSDYGDALQQTSSGLYRQFEQGPSGQFGRNTANPRDPAGNQYIVSCSAQQLRRALISLPILVRPFPVDLQI